MPRRPLTTAALVAALGLGLLAAPASVADNGAKSRIKITRLSSTLMKGKVSSEKAKCVGGRHVQVFRYEGFFSVKLGRFDSGPDGRWSFEASFIPGRYFAKVDSRSGCRYAVSATATLD